MDEESDLKYLECVSVLRDKHFLVNPKLLSCGHFICGDCMENEIENNNKRRCGVCKIKQNVNLEDNQATVAMNKIIKTQLNNMIQALDGKFNTTLKSFKKDFKETQQLIETEYEDLRIDIRKRAKDLKLEIDKVCEQVDMDLDNHKALTYRKLDKLKSEIGNIENEMSKNMRKYAETNESIRVIQNKLDSMSQFRQQLDSLQEKVCLESTDKVLDFELIGYINYKNNLETEALTVPDMFNQTMSLDLYPLSFCVKEDQLLVGDFVNGILCCYDDKLKQIKRIEKVGQYEIKPFSIATNNRDRIYISDEEKLLMIDINFKLISTKISQELVNPNGICFSNDLLYVCDCENKKIHRYDDKLKLEKSFQLEFRPWYIQVIGDLACVRHINEPYLSFFNLPEFSLKYRYDSHNGYILTIGSYFYEFCQPETVVYCYNSDGTIRYSKSFALPADTYISKFSPVVYFKNKFIFAADPSMDLILQ